MELEYSLTFTTLDARSIFMSIINNGLIPGGQDLSRRQTVFFLPIDPRDENHKDPEHIDFSVPRRARYVHSAWKRHQDAVFWVDIDLAIREGLTFYQTRSNAIILQGTLPAHCIVKVERLKTGEMLYERRYLTPRAPPKISLKHDLNWTEGNDQSGSTVEHQPVGRLVQQSLGEALQAGSSKPTQFLEGVSVSQSSLSVASDRTGKPVGKSNIDQFSFGVRNTYSAHSKFSENTQAEKMVDRTGKLEGESSSNAQIRTLLDEQRQMSIAEYCEKIGHHELEEERRILQEELWRQQKDFREVSSSTKSY